MILKIFYSLIALFVLFILMVFFEYFKLKPADNKQQLEENNVDLLFDQQKSNDESKESERNQPLFSFAIGGDVMFDRGVDYTFRGDKIFNIFDQFTPNTFKDKDLAIVNFEGPISSTEIVADNTVGNMVFNFPPKSGQVVKDLSINSVSLANNHSLNNGQSGFEYTRNKLSSLGINVIGSQNIIDSNSVGHFNNNDFRVSVIAANCIDGCQITQIIQKESQSSNFVLVFPHWGVEYTKTHSTSQEKLAREWIDAGADLVVGSHPHVIQDAMIYKNVPIFFSLGNLVFDQTFSKETQEGLVLDGEIWDDSVKIGLYPTQSIKLKPNFLSGEDKSDFQKNFYKFFNQTYKEKDNNSLVFAL